MTPVQKLQLKNAVEKVLHAPCNAIKEKLEWAFVFDFNLPKEEVSNMSKEIVNTLKQHSQIFRNARLNVVEWKSDDEIEHKIVSMPLIQTGSHFKDYKIQKKEKRIEELAVQLKLYQARSKLIILLTDEKYLLEDMNKWEQHMNPFLFKRMFLVHDNKCKFLSTAKAVDGSKVEESITCY